MDQGARGLRKSVCRGNLGAHPGEPFVYQKGVSLAALRRKAQCESIWSPITMNVVHGQVEIKSNRSVEVIDITEIVQSWVAKNNAEDGILTVFSVHTTAGLTINEAESGLM
jgi:hypothetical protein